MYDPFKKVRARSRRKIRRATVTALTDAWGEIFSTATPAKRKPKKSAVKATKPTAARLKVAKGAPQFKSTSKVKIPATSQSSTIVPRGGAFKAGTHASDFGARSHMLYVPKVATTVNGPLPLIVMLHGCGQTPWDFALGTGMNTLAEEFGFLVLYPEQDRKAHNHRCWNWYRTEDQGRGAGEPALIASMTRQIIDEQSIDPSKVYVTGLSAGGSAALILAAAYPDIFAAVGVHSGLAVGAAHDANSVPRAMQFGATGRRLAAQMPTIIFHGDADKVVSPRNGRFIAIRAVEPYNNLDKTEKIGRVAGGREFSRTVHRVGRGRSYAEQWVVLNSGHAWSGGNAAGSYTDPKGPDASREMVRFFLNHRTTKKRRANVRVPVR